MRVLGTDHPDTLASRNNLASAYESAGRLTSAIELYEQNVNDAERVLSAGHPWIAVFRENLDQARAAQQFD